MISKPELSKAISLKIFLKNFRKRLDIFNSLLYNLVRAKIINKIRQVR